MIALVIGMGTQDAAAEVCPGDLNSDSVVDVFDLLILLEEWGDCDDPADCPADLNGDGVVDVFDLLILLENWGACPAKCGSEEAGSCCKANDSPYCDDAACCEQICDSDQFCCENEWDSFCALQAENLCLNCGVDPDCGVVGTGDCCQANDTPSCQDDRCCEIVCDLEPFCCVNVWDDTCADLANEVCEICDAEPGCGVQGNGDCCEANGTPYCDDAACCEQICDSDPFCCENEWDSFCATQAENVCLNCGADPDCGVAGTGNCCSPNSTPSCEDDRCCNLVCDDDPFCCDTVWDGTCASAAITVCEACDAEPGCGVQGTGDCCEANDTPYCDDVACCDLICDQDPFCCGTEWDSICADLADDQCAVCQ
ncbi:MAG: hypothetical protein EA377_12770 [Phycisphaerales bacterium]|nr:MAG: hypothetical protein EA377_12770 [Phycisphaerales bacterium]